jgi:hypothetical protein
MSAPMSILREDMLDMLNDQNVDIPPLVDLFPASWPSALHDSYAEGLKEDIREWLER